MSPIEPSHCSVVKKCVKVIRPFTTSTTSEETKKSKRENLDQKQILVPELCSIHPFPASLWRQTVALPCVLYRLNGLLIADQLRSLVAREAHLGQVCSLKQNLFF